MAHELLVTLENDHDEVKAILDKLENTSKTAKKTKEDLFLKLKRHLIPHMKGEEKHLYSALTDDKEGHEVALESLEEHHVAEMVLQELDSLDKDAENWDAKLKVFKELVEHHIEEEEEEVFRAAEEAFNEDQLDDMMSSFVEEKKTVMQKMK
jgi:hemerythrin-like domain-containing protein